MSPKQKVVIFSAFAGASLTLSVIECDWGAQYYWFWWIAAVLCVVAGTLVKQADRAFKTKLFVPSLLMGAALFVVWLPFISSKYGAVFENEMAACSVLCISFLIIAMIEPRSETPAS